MRCLNFLATGVALLMSAATCAGATTNELYVADGTTNTLTKLLGDTTVSAGDCLMKTGPGTLTDDKSVAEIALDIIVDEGVWNAPQEGSHTASPSKGYNHCVVKKGATLRVGSKKTFTGFWILEFEGEGTGKDGNLGAIVVATDAQDVVFGSEGSIKRLTDDATIYSASASYNGFFCTDILDCQGHTLTLKAASTGYRFRPRWNWTIRNPGAFIVDKYILDRHYDPSQTKTTVESPIPLVKFINEASMASLPNGSVWSDVVTFEFDAGCSTVKASNARDTVDELSMNRLVGPLAVTSLMQLTVTNELVSRASDLNAGNKLSSVNTLTLGADCRVSVRGWGSTKLVPGQTYDMATVTTGDLAGEIVAAEPAGKIFTFAKSGKTLQATLRGNVVYADFAEGDENAAANSARLAELASTLDDGDVLVASDGEYAFTDGVADLSALTKRNVTILGENGGAKLKATLKLGAAENLSVEGVTFLGTTGPALDANGTAGLTVTACTLDGVVGTTTDGAYPFVLKDVTDFGAYGIAFVNGAGYAGQALFDGGSQVASSEIVSGAFTIKVLPGETLNWADAKARLPLAAGAYAGQRLRLIGGGTLAPGVTLADDGVEGVEIVAGKFSVRANAELGVLKKTVFVRAGGCLELNGGSSNTIDRRTVHVAGTGVDANHGAVHFMGNSYWQRTNYIVWELDADATMTSAQGDTSNGTFLYSTVKANGHALTLYQGAWRFGWDCRWTGGGRMIVDNAKVSASSGSSTTWPVWTTFVNDPENPGRFFFRNKAQLVPDSPELLSMVNDVVFETADCVLGYNVGGHVASTNMPKNYVFRRFAGVPQIVDPTASAAAKMGEGARQISVTVTNEFVALAANVFAAEPAVLTLPKGDLTFARGCRFTLDEPTGHARGTYELCRVAGDGATITGHPLATGDTREAQWATRVSADRQTLYLCERPGLFLIVR